MTHIRYFSTSFYVAQRLDHPLIWHVDWIKVQAGFFAIVDPNDPGHLLYLSNKSYETMLRTALSNDSPLIVVARPGESKPLESSIRATKPDHQNSPVFFRTFRVYSRLLRKVWDSMFEGRLVVPLDRNIKCLISSWAKTLLLWTGTSSKSKSLDSGILVVVKTLRRVLSNHGARGLALFLKVSLIAMNRYLAGQPLASTWELKRAIRLTGGLPSWFPLEIRSAIRNRSNRVIRFWSSLLYIYKGLYAKAPPSLGEVEAPAALATRTLDLWLKSFTIFLVQFWMPHIGIGKASYPVASEYPPLLSNAGPNDGVALQGWIRDAWLWRLCKGSALYEALIQVLAMTSNHVALGALTHGYQGLDLSRQVVVKSRRVPTLAKLSLIYEAAGKVRVVAILDYFTQWALRPLHDALGKILTMIEQDGTADQSACLGRFQDTIARLPGGTFSSLDISSATDMIPWQLYECILDALYDNRFARMCLRLMRDRYFLSPREMPLRRLRYGRGQPMGCLGSFPLLGLVHHGLVQYAAFLAGRFPFQTYAIVGDDLLLYEIGDSTPVADQYLLLCKELGIPISSLKSYQSASFYNFISRSFLNGIEVSPASVRQELSIRSMSHRVESAFQLLGRGWGLVGSTERNIVSRLARLVTDSYRWEEFRLFAPHGYLSPYLSLLLSAALVPAPSVSARLGVRVPDILSWASSLRGSTQALSRGGLELLGVVKGEQLNVARTLTRTAMLALQSQVLATLEKISKVDNLYISWLVAQSASIRTIYPHIHASTDLTRCNVSTRELFPLIGIDTGEPSLLELPDYESITGMSHEELMESYQIELVVYNMGYLIPFKALYALRDFYLAYTTAFADDVPFESLGPALHLAFGVLTKLTPSTDFENKKLFSSRRSYIERVVGKSFLNRSRLPFARGGHLSDIISIVSLSQTLLSRLPQGALGLGGLQALPSK